MKYIGIQNPEIIFDRLRDRTNDHITRHLDLVTIGKYEFSNGKPCEPYYGNRSFFKSDLDIIDETKKFLEKDEYKVIDDIVVAALTNGDEFILGAQVSSKNIFPKRDAKRGKGDIEKLLFRFDTKNFYIEEGFYKGNPREDYLRYMVNINVNSKCQFTKKIPVGLFKYKSNFTSVPVKQQEFEAYLARFVKQVEVATKQIYFMAQQDIEDFPNLYITSPENKTFSGCGFNTYYRENVPVHIFFEKRK